MVKTSLPCFFGNFRKTLPSPLNEEQTHLTYLIFPIKRKMKLHHEENLSTSRGNFVGIVMQF